MTLIGLLLATAVTGMVAASFYALFILFHKNYRLQEAAAEAQQQARVAQGVIAEVEQAGYDPMGTLFKGVPGTAGKVPVFRNGQCRKTVLIPEPVMEATPNIIHYIADVNGNGRLYVEDIHGKKDIDSDEDVRFSWVGERPTKETCRGKEYRPWTLYRDSGGGGQEASLNIVLFRLDYFDEEGNQFPAVVLDTAQRARIRKIVSTLRAQASAAGLDLRPNVRTLELTSSIRLKALKPN